MGPVKGGVCASLRAKLEKDPYGEVILVGLDCGGMVDPPLREKERLRSEFGLYPLGWEEPFGREHLVEPDDLEGFLQVRMVRVESEGSEGRYHVGGGHGRGEGLLTKLPRPQFSVRVEDWREFAIEWSDWQVLMREAYPDLSERALLELLNSPKSL